MQLLFVKSVRFLMILAGSISLAEGEWLRVAFFVGMMGIASIYAEILRGQNRQDKP
jgi:hypothetical protein